jgi:hypothetical protein
MSNLIDKKEEGKNGRLGDVFGDGGCYDIRDWIYHSYHNRGRNINQITSASGSECRKP